MRENKSLSLKNIIITIIISGIFLLVVSDVVFDFLYYNVYKSFMNFYNQEKEPMITVSLNEKENDGDYLEFQNIKFADVGKDYLLSEKNKDGVIYLNEGVGLISLEKKSFIDFVKEEMFREEYFDYMLKKNKIKTDDDLLNFVESYKYNDSWLFKSERDIAIGQSFNWLVTNAVIINGGDYSGYIKTNYLSEDGVCSYNIYLKQNENSVVITIMGRISLEEVYEILSTVTID